MDLDQMIGMEKRPAIELKQFLIDYKAALEEFHIKTPEPPNIQERMDVDEERFATAAANCSLTHLEQNDDQFVEKFIPGRSQINYKTAVNVPPVAMKMNTITALIAAKDKSIRNPFRRSHHSYPFASLPEVASDAVKCRFYNDLIVTIRVYRPARATHLHSKIEKPVFAEEFECLGTNTLTEFRDKISCVCNKKRFFDISENPHSELPDKETDPGYFFISDTFYNDNRNPQNPDYSKTIIDWAQKAIGMRHMEFKVAKMEETRFIDLNINLGFPQLYQHHGNCEHVFVFSQVQVITPSSECTYINQYPRLRSYNTFNNRLCNLCGSMHYSFIVEGSDRQLHDPAYVCKGCFFSFHYVDGKKIGEFKAYRVRGDSISEDVECQSDPVEAEIEEINKQAEHNSGVGTEDEAEFTYGIIMNE